MTTKAQYATSGMDQQLFVSRYLTKLPSPEEIRDLIERDQAVFEEQSNYNPRLKGRQPAITADLSEKYPRIKNNKHFLREVRC